MTFRSDDAFDAILDRASELQPDFAISSKRRRNASGRRRQRTRPKGLPGRPTIEDEKREKRFSGRMTAETAATIAKVGVNVSMLIERAARAIETGDASVILELALDPTP